MLCVMLLNVRRRSWPRCCRSSGGTTPPSTPTSTATVRYVDGCKQSITSEPTRVLLSYHTQSHLLRLVCTYMYPSNNDSPAPRHARAGADGGERHRRRRQEHGRLVALCREARGAVRACMYSTLGRFGGWDGWLGFSAAAGPAGGDADLRTNPSIDSKPNADRLWRRRPFFRQGGEAGAEVDRGGGPPGQAGAGGEGLMRLMYVGMGFVTRELALNGWRGACACVNFD